MAVINILEDDEVIRGQLSQLLRDKGYEVIESADISSFNKIDSENTDLYLLDVYLPDGDGFSVCEKLRSEGCVTPVIFLTSCDDEDSITKGLDIGGDDYITKPFSATYLQARVENLLMQRKKLQSFYRDSLMHINISTGQEEVPVATDMPSAEEDVSETPPTTLEMSPNDRKFMDKLVGLMEQNMDNGELVVDDLVRELAVSRSVFFKKLKTLTGLAPIEFIKEMRIKRATQLIETGEFNMTQISYMVGINDPRYFSKCFKAQVGMTPTEYRDRVGR